MNDFDKIDLHMHTTVSDGTDTPEQILEYVKEAGITLFSVTDHDAVKGGEKLLKVLKNGDPKFITGAEFSCKEYKAGGKQEKFHILGYGYDPEAPAMRQVVETGHAYRMEKLDMRLKGLAAEFGFTFSKEDHAALYSMDNPGKPHIGNLMVKYGYTETKEQAINQYINKLHVRGQYFRPKEAIEGILGAGGIPVLAHPSYGSGDQLILGEEMDERLRKLMDFGLQGVEAFYSGFTPAIQREVLAFADKYHLYVTAGSDYHGRNKMVVLGDTNLGSRDSYPEGLLRFLEDISPKIV